MKADFTSAGKNYKSPDVLNSVRSFASAFSAGTTGNYKPEVAPIAKVDNSFIMSR